MGRRDLLRSLLQGDLRRLNPSLKCLGWHQT